MKKNRIIALVLAALLLTVVFVGCAQDKTPEASKAPETEAPKTEAPKTEAPKTEAPKTEATETEAPATQDDFWFTLNGVEIRMGVPFAELKEKLGEEAKPSETIESCDENSDWVQIMHFYPGITVNEDKNGNVFGVSMSDYDVGPGDVTLNGQLKLGVSTRDDIVAVFGEPEPNEYGIFYDMSGYMIALYLDEETAKLSSVMVSESVN